MGYLDSKVEVGRRYVIKGLRHRNVLLVKRPDKKNRYFVFRSNTGKTYSYRNLELSRLVKAGYATEVPLKGAFDFFWYRFEKANINENAEPLKGLCKHFFDASHEPLKKAIKLLKANKSKKSIDFLAHTEIFNK